ncbi:hypothetical protein B0T14DRAFT_537342 [Immersiella caudata]|uniref:Transcription factor TFIIIC triple barrel domain-containing protein n=1 Tax=Immersiella caudata TaxID=314043 RepID=A0AA40BZW3_9PEZI|nr:hypothetical protein B0T14DRAFT_537342 [Immersiella caudata]
MSRQTDPAEDDDEWEHEYSATETEFIGELQTYYLTLDLSVRDFLERRPDDQVIHNTRGGYRVWYNPLFNAVEPRPSHPELIADNQDGEAPEREDRELDNIGLQAAADEQAPIDPMLERPESGGPQEPAISPDEPMSEIQILDLHSDEPLVSYRNHIFRGTWYENIGTELIFTPHDKKAPLPALRNLNHGIDLLAASSARVHFKEATLIPKSEAEILRMEAARQGELNEEELPERYKRNGGVYVHVGGDKSGQRQPQAHFLEDLISLKRSRGETDEVTVQPSETRHNELMVNDAEEERRRKKLQTDQARALRWRETRKEGVRLRAKIPSACARRSEIHRVTRGETAIHLALAASFGGLVFALWALSRILHPIPPDDFERERDKQWVNSSPYWIDRQMCRWLSLCGVAHLRWDAPAISDEGSDQREDLKLAFFRALALGLSAGRTFVTKSGVSSWETAPMRSDLKGKRVEAQQFSGDKILEEIPDYVLAHAPLVHLSSWENFWPADIIEHIKHMEPLVENKLVNTTVPLDIAHLGKLNAADGIVFLSSKDDVETRPAWLHSRVGIPVPYDDGDDDNEDEGRHDHGEEKPSRPDGGRSWWDADKEHPPHRIVDPRKRPVRPHHPLRSRSYGEAQHPIVGSAKEEINQFSDDNKPDASGYSKGPAVLVVVDKGSGVLDAFWFFFYSYNLGQTVLNIRFGNHVGDWEHCMIRFEHGTPRAMFLSEHAGGKAYAWKAMEKKTRKGSAAERPVIYSAVGSHAMYALGGLHPYVLPFKLLADVTDKGPLWDPALNHYAFCLTPAASNPDLPTSWFHFEGYWGDDIYPLSDERQWRLFSEYHYTTGPLGPKFKNLDRRKVCQMEKCTIVESIKDGEKSAWY